MIDPKKRSATNRILRFFKTIYLKLFRINDTPQKIAAGFGLGVFLGVMPGVGPIAALALAVLFKVNKASALLGSILTNTWMSIPVFVLAVKTGSLVTGMRYKAIYDGCMSIFHGFTWAKLFQTSFYDIIFPVALGYAIVSICIGATAYLVVLAIVTVNRRRS